MAEKRKFNKKITDKLKTLPESSGVYIMKNENDEIIYVGKAKVLKNRVKSYFNNDKNKSMKVIKMVEHIDHFDYIVTKNEMEALILECNLIKHNMPKYNILLTDDKTYPFIKVTVNDEYPKFTMSRKKEDDKAKYFGPYTSTNAVYNIIEMIHKIFKLPSCNKKFPQDIKKTRPCLNKHIGNCIGVCTGRISKEEYREIFEEAMMFLSGSKKSVVDMLNQKMLAASESLEFEKAAKIRDRIEAIRKIDTEQKVVLSDMSDKDVIVIMNNANLYCIVHFVVRDGKMISSEHHMLKKEEIESEEMALCDIIKHIYMNDIYIPDTILVNIYGSETELIERWLSEKKGKKVEIKIPQKGEYKKLYDMAFDNAREQIIIYKQKGQRQNKELVELTSLLGLDDIPEKIESYDISNIAGASNVGVLVSFINGIPKKKLYRRFDIKTISGPDDYAALTEVLSRRFTRYTKRFENTADESFDNLPDIIIADGGAGHVNTALAVLEKFDLKIPVFGMVKDNKHNVKALCDGNGNVIEFMKNEPARKLIYSLQEEVHGFAIRSHRIKHRNNTLTLELENIEGIGEKRAILLLKEFGSIEKIKNAGVEELSSIKGMNKTAALNIYNYYNK